MKKIKIRWINYRSNGEDVDVYYSELVGNNSRANMVKTLDRMLLHRLQKYDELIKYLEDDS
jgi:hypothetical protein